MSPRIQVVHPSEAEVLWVVRDRIRFMGEVAGTGLSVLEVEVPPGSGTPPHLHASPEIFRVLDGEIAFGIFEDGAAREVVAGAGAVVTVPSRVAHGYRNAGVGPATMLVVVERLMIDFFRDLGRLETPPQGPPNDAELAAVFSACARHDISLLSGPTV